jgi:hypothetical protein
LCPFGIKWMKYEKRRVFIPAACFYAWCISERLRQSQPRSREYKRACCTWGGGYLRRAVLGGWLALHMCIWGTLTSLLVAKTHNEARNPLTFDWVNCIFSPLYLLNCYLNEFLTATCNTNLKSSLETLSGGVYFKRFGTFCHQ